MPRKKAKKRSLGAVLVATSAYLFVAFLIGFVVWFFFWMDSPMAADENPEVAPPVNNTPFVGRKW
jgi:cell division septal protein FtsQ